MPREDGTPTTAERGYGAAHRRERQAAARLVAYGLAFCSRCGSWIQPGTAWDLDHTDDRLGYAGPAHASCNRRAGQAKTARILRRRRAWSRAAGNASRRW